MAQAAGFSFNTDTVDGTTVRDLAGYFLHGTIVGSAAVATGKTGYGNALNCTGGAMQVVAQADTYPVNADGGVSVAAWVKLNDTTAAARCIASAKDGDGDLRWALYASNASGNVEALINGVVASTTTSIRDGGWHHVALVFDRTAGPGLETVRIFVDGVAAFTATNQTIGLSYDAGATIEVGRLVTTGLASLNGHVDDVRWWNDPVETSYIDDVMAAEQIDFQQAIYALEGTVADYSGYGRDLAQAPSASFTDGMYGKALVSTSAAAGASGTVNLPDCDRLAITGWLRLDTTPVGTAAPILALRTSGGSDRVRVVVNLDRTITATWTTINYGVKSVTSTAALVEDAWTRVHINMNPTYVGIRVGTTSQQTTATGNTFPHLAATVDSLNVLYLGGDEAVGGQVSWNYVTLTKNYIDDPARYWLGAPALDPYVPLNVPRGIYMMNEGSGLTSLDESQAGNDLTFATAGSWVTGIEGQAIGASGIQQGASNTSLSWPATPPGWSYSMWVKRRASSTGARFLAMRNGSQEVAHSGVLSGQLWARLYSGGTTPGLIQVASAPIPSETWTHVAVSFDGHLLTFYLNGEYKASVAYTPGALNSPTILNLGGDNDLAEGSVADVDDLRLYDTPISGANIQWFYENTGQYFVPLSVQSASHSQTAQSPTLTQSNFLDSNDATHGHTATSPTLSQLIGTTLVPSNARHAHTAGSPLLAQLHALLVSSALHGHTAGTPTLVDSGTLIVAAVFHALTSQSPVLTQDVIVSGKQVKFPVYQRAVGGPPLLHRYSLDYPKSLVKLNGSWAEVISPDQYTLSIAENYYIGGYTYALTDAEAADLPAEYVEDV